MFYPDISMKSLEKEFREMDFVSGLFLLFLVIGIIVFYSIPKKWQQYWLLLLSMFFYCYVSVKLFAVMLVSVAISYVGALAIEGQRGETTTNSLSHALGKTYVSSSLNADSVLNQTEMQKAETEAKAAGTGAAKTDTKGAGTGSAKTETVKADTAKPDAAKTKTVKTDTAKIGAERIEAAKTSTTKRIEKNQGKNHENENRRAESFLLGITIVLLAGILFFLKTAAAAPSIAGRLHIERFAVLLPIGISFYTLQMISYLTDVFQGKIRAEKKPLRYLLYITYFPQILQGPIPRYETLMPQLLGQHSFRYETFVGGFELMLWGYFQKLVIADRANIMVNRLFGEYQSFPGIYMLLAGVLYSLQLYTDFNGCVCIARGVSQMLGITLDENFRHPYFATSIREFWRRWHMSLSSRLRDYIYIPLGGSRKGKLRRYVNILITFAVSGIWHGIGLHYFVWGLLHGFYQILGDVCMPLRDFVVKCLHVDRNTFSHRLFRQVITFLLVMLAWIFFRADSVSQAVFMIKSMVTVFNPWILWDGSMYLLGLSAKNVWLLFGGIAILFVVSLLQTKVSLRTKLMEQGIVFRYAVVLLAAIAILVFGIYGPGYDAAQFIYGGF